MPEQPLPRLLGEVRDRSDAGHVGRRVVSGGGHEGEDGFPLPLLECGDVRHVLGVSGTLIGLARATGKRDQRVDRAYHRRRARHHRQRCLKPSSSTSWRRVFRPCVGPFRRDRASAASAGFWRSPWCLALPWAIAHRMPDWVFSTPATPEARAGGQAGVP